MKEKDRKEILKIIVQEMDFLNNISFKISKNLKISDIEKRKLRTIFKFIEDTNNNYLKENINIDKKEEEELLEINRNLIYFAIIL